MDGIGGFSFLSNALSGGTPETSPGRARSMRKLPIAFSRVVNFTEAAGIFNPDSETSEGGFLYAVEPISF
jgi:hypothetical protein